MDEINITGGNKTMSEYRLGILGGMGPQATNTLYQFIINHTDAATDQEHVNTLILSDSGIPDRTAAILSGNTQPALQRLLAGARLLEQGGCTVIAIPCNTAHYFVPQLQQQVGVPILHMIREMAKLLCARGCKRPGILATDGTIQTGLYQRELEAFGIQAAVPGPQAQKSVMSLIYDDIKAGRPGDAEKLAFVRRDLDDQGCDCAVLACTELSVFATQHPLPADYYMDSMELLAVRAIQACHRPLRGGDPFAL